MNHNYDDIRSRIAEEPTWFDEHAVPRYGAFEPGNVADIYADEAILVEITCQGCGHKFAVAFSKGMLNRDDRPLSRCIAVKDVHYGDPPNIGCCASGPTMNSEPRRVLEYWFRHVPSSVDAETGIVRDVRAYMEWRRNPAFEVDVTPDWVSDT